MNIGGAFKELWQKIRLKALFFLSFFLSEAPQNVSTNRNFVFSAIPFSRDFSYNRLKVFIPTPPVYNFSALKL